MAARESKSGVTNGGSTTPQQDCFPLHQKYAYSHSGHCPCPCPCSCLILHFNPTWFFPLTVHRSQLFLFLLGSHSHSSNFLFIYFLCVVRLGSSVTCVTNVSVFSQLNVDTSGIFFFFESRHVRNLDRPNNKMTFLLLQSKYGWSYALHLICLIVSLANDADYRPLQCSKFYFLPLCLLLR